MSRGRVHPQVAELFEQTVSDVAIKRRLNAD